MDFRLLFLLCISLYDCSLWGQCSDVEFYDDNKVELAPIILYPELDKGCRLLGNNPSFDSFFQRKNAPLSQDNDCVHSDIVQAQQYITRSMQQSLVHVFASGVQSDVDVATVRDPKMAYVLTYYDRFMAPYHYRCIDIAIEKWKKNDTDVCSNLLYQAARNNVPIIVQILLSYNVDPNSQSEQSKNGDTALAAAVRHNSIAMVSMLLDAKADPNVMISEFDKDLCRDQLLHYAVNFNLIDVLQLLMKAGAFLNGLGDFDATPLCNAVNHGRFKMVALLLTAGADANKESLFSLSPLHLAANNNRLDITVKLLEFGANPNAKNFNNETPLTIAITNSFTQVAGVLIADKNIDLNLVDEVNNTPLHYAAKSNISSSIMDILLQLGAHTNIKNNSGMTALHYAVKKESLAKVKLLLSYQADVFVKNNNNEMPLDIVRNHRMSYERNNVEAPVDIDTIFKILYVACSPEITHIDMNHHKRKWHKSHQN